MRRMIQVSRNPDYPQRTVQFPRYHPARGGEARRGAARRG